MSATYQPTGLRLVGTGSNGNYSGRVRSYPLTTNNTDKIAVGDPVALVAGSIAPISASPAAGTLSANTPVGVVVGIEYKDPVNPGRALVESQVLAANAISSLGYLDIVIRVADDKNAQFKIQANGSVPASDLGSLVDMGGFGTADLVARTSRVYADSATLGNANAALRIVGFYPDILNAAGDSKTVLVVTWNEGVHYFDQAGAH